MASRSMPESRDAKLLQVLSRQVREDGLVNVVIAERSLILSEAQAPQPDHHVHGWAPNSGLLPPRTFRLSAMKLAGEPNNTTRFKYDASAEELRQPIMRRLTVLSEAGIIDLTALPTQKRGDQKHGPGGPREISMLLIPERGGAANNLRPIFAAAGRRAARPIATRSIYGITGPIAPTNNGI